MADDARQVQAALGSVFRQIGLAGPQIQTMTAPHPHVTPLSAIQAASHSPVHDTHRLQCHDRVALPHYETTAEAGRRFEKAAHSTAQRRVGEGHEPAKPPTHHDDPKLSEHSCQEDADKQLRAKHNCIPVDTAGARIGAAPIKMSLEAISIRQHIQRRMETRDASETAGGIKRAPSQPPNALQSILDGWLPDSRDNLVSMADKIEGIIGFVSTMLGETLGLRRPQTDPFDSPAALRAARQLDEAAALLYSAWRQGFRPAAMVLNRPLPSKMLDPAHKKKLQNRRRAIAAVYGRRDWCEVGFGDIYYISQHMQPLDMLISAVEHVIVRAGLDPNDTKSPSGVGQETGMMLLHVCKSTMSAWDLQMNRLKLLPWRQRFGEASDSEVIRRTNSRLDMAKKVLSRQIQGLQIRLRAPEKVTNKDKSQSSLGVAAPGQMSGFEQRELAFRPDTECSTSEKRQHSRFTLLDGGSTMSPVPTSEATEQTPPWLRRKRHTSDDEAGERRVFPRIESSSLEPEGGCVDVKRRLSEGGRLASGRHLSPGPTATGDAPDDSCESLPTPSSLSEVARGGLAGSFAGEWDFAPSEIVNEVSRSHQ